MKVKPALGLFVAHPEGRAARAARVGCVDGIKTVDNIHRKVTLSVT